MDLTRPKNRDAPATRDKQWLVCATTGNFREPRQPFGERKRHRGEMSTNLEVLVAHEVNNNRWPRECPDIRTACACTFS
jgi:hypothetical protein